MATQKRIKPSRLRQNVTDFLRETEIAISRIKNLLTEVPGLMPPDELSHVVQWMKMAEEIAVFGQTATVSDAMDAAQTVGDYVSNILRFLHERSK